MIITAFDLGVRNFAFIIVSSDCNNNIHILEWENVDMNADNWTNIL